MKHLAVVLLASVLLLSRLCRAGVEGVYYINTCLKDAPCCLEGYVGVASTGHLAFNLAGFSSSCPPSLRRGYDECKGQAKGGSQNSIVYADTTIPHPTDGPQHMKITFTGETIFIRNTNSERAISSASGMRISSLKDGLLDGTVRDPVEIATLRDMEHPSGLSKQGAAALGIFLCAFVGTIFYGVGGVLYKHRNGGTWDGPLQHVHQEIFTTTFTSVKQHVQEKASNLSASLHESKETLKAKASDASRAIGSKVDAVRTKVHSNISGSKHQAEVSDLGVWATMDDAEIVIAATGTPSKAGGPVPQDVSGSPSKTRRTKSHFGSIFKAAESHPVAPSEDLQVYVEEEPRAISSPQRRASLSHRHVAVETRGEFV